ncbi:MAG: HipA domain-containing protein [Clostridia bacterium]|nr:HipA domain-containing protein [Clostridia bacterium]
MIELVNPKYNNKLNLEISLNTISPKAWVKYDQNDYLFKGNRESKKTNFGEVLYSSMCKKLGIDCVQTHIARIKGNLPEKLKNSNNGVLVKNYLNDDVIFNFNYEDMIKLNNKICDWCDYICVDDCVENIKIYTDNIRYDIDLEKTRIELYKRAIMDFFLAQRDRHCENFEFLVYPENFELAPMFDNSISLSFNNTKTANKQIIKDIKVYYEEYFICAYKMYLNKKFLMLKNNLEDEEFCDIFTKQLALLCNENQEIKNFVSKILNIDILSEIKKVEKEQKYKLAKEYKLSAEKIFNRRVELFKSNYKKENNRNKSELAKQ